jgi:eukaryotic-like serine/threonine-protein kinase
MIQNALVFHALKPSSPAAISKALFKSHAMPAKKVGRWIDRFYVINELGHGSTGTVYLAYDPVIRCNVAIKTFNRPLSMLEEKRIKSHFIGKDMTGRLSHPNIVQIHDVSAGENLSYLTMEYLHGSELGKLIKDGRKFTVREAAGIACKVAKALDHAHKNNVVHRNIKPANIFITHNNQIKVSDFDTARLPDLNLKGQLSASPRDKSGADNTLAELAYLTPEQASGKAVDKCSDIYGLGTLMYEMMTHQQPFHADSPEKLLDMIAHKVPVDPHELNIDIPLPLSQIIMKAMSKNPENRYQNAKEMANEIKSCLAYPPSKLDKHGAKPASAGVAGPAPVAASQKSRKDLHKVAERANSALNTMGAHHFTAAPPLFSSLDSHTPDLSDAAQQGPTFKTFSYVFIVLTAALLGGGLLLNGFGISYAALHVAGGLTFALVGYRMLFQVSHPKAAAAPARIPFILTRSGITSPGAIAILLSISTELDTLGMDQQKVFLYAAAAGGVALVLLLTWFSSRLASLVSLGVGRDGLTIVARLAGFMMICVGMQYLASGVHNFLSIA